MQGGIDVKGAGVVFIKGNEEQKVRKREVSET